jgi:2-polyprenyl-3-methyl-5-hydroxy-6-metoxy-1,4-benzoquinol methylase
VGAEQVDLAAVPVEQDHPSRDGRAGVDRALDQGVAKLGEENRYDLITTFDVIHDQARPAAVLVAGISKALRPEGDYLMQDIAGSSHVHNNLDHLLGPLMYTISTMHCMTRSRRAAPA